MKNKILGIFIIFVVIFFGIVTFYKLKNDKEETKEHYFVSSEIKNAYKSDINIDDKEVYKDYIITDVLTDVDYSFLCEGESITGRVYIDSSKKLHITDSNKNIDLLLSTDKFKTIYFKDYKYSDGVYLYLLSQKNELYFLDLESNDVKNANLYNSNYDVKFTNFVDVDYTYDLYTPSNSVFAITTDGLIYSVNDGMRYDATVKSLFNSLYIYNDSYITNNVGNLLQDNDGNNYRIKYIFSIIKDSNNYLSDNVTVVIVTDDDRLIYVENDLTYVYEFDKKVKDVSFDVNYPYIDGNLDIIFEDDYKMNFTARCNEYFCPNEFAE